MRNRIFTVAVAILSALLISTLTFCIHDETLPPQPHTGTIVDDALPVTFAILGDSRPKHGLEIGMEKAAGVAAAVMQRIAEENPAFVLHLGDIATRGALDRYWNSFDRDSAPIRDKRIPFYAVIGNHEFMGGNVEDGLRNYFARFPHLTGKRWYSLRVRNLLIVALDSNFKELTAKEADEQDRWLETTMKLAEMDAGVTFVLLACHHPPYSNAAIHGGNNDVQKRFVERARQCRKVVVFFSGHVHSYERFAMDDGIMYVVSGGGGSPRHRLSLEGKREYDDRYKGGELRNFHFCKFTLREDLLVGEMMAYDEKGGRWFTGETFELRPKSH